MLVMWIVVWVTRRLNCCATLHWIYNTHTVAVSVFRHGPSTSPLLSCGVPLKDNIQIILTGITSTCAMLEIIYMNKMQIQQYQLILSYQGETLLPCDFLLRAGLQPPPSERLPQSAALSSPDIHNVALLDLRLPETP